MEEIKIGVQNTDWDDTQILDDTSTLDDTSYLIENPESEPLSDDNNILKTTDEQVSKQIEWKTIIEELSPVETPKVEDTSSNTNSSNWNNFYWNKLVTIRKEEEKPVELKKEIKAGEKTEYEKSEEEKKSTWDLFVNYDSEFHKNEKTIMQKIMQLKMIPKTRLWFVSALIIFAVTGVWIMMKIDPENHSIDNYKANIFAVIWKKEEVKENPVWWKNTWVQNSETWVMVNTWTSTEISTGITENVNTWSTSETATWTIENTSSWALQEKEETMIKEKWLTIQPEIIPNPDGTLTYIYKWKSFTKEWLQEELRKEVELEIDKKTKDHLNKIYISH